MPLTYRCFRNKNTGQLCYAPAGRYGNFLNSIKKLASYIRYNMPRYYVAHLTLTLKEATTDIDTLSKNLHRTLQFIDMRLKRLDSEFKYIAVKEIQKERLEKYGEEAVHYHVLCIYSKPYVFPSPVEIANSWKLGGVKITAPKLRLKLNAIANYIGKYIGKGYEYEELDVKKSFTASQIKQIYKLSASRLAEVIRRYGFNNLKFLTCTYRKVFLEGWEDMTGVFGKVFKRKTRVLLIEFPSEWSYEGVVREPF